MYAAYKKLCSNIGGRLWTYIYRDFWHKYEYFAQMQWLWTGILIANYLTWNEIWLVVAVYFYGYLNGHFFWGTKWIRGQKGV